MKYYRMKRILAKGADYNIIYGGRASGKSYAMAEYLLDDYLENGHQFVRLLRSYSYAKGIETYFSEVVANNPQKYKDIEVTCERLTYYVNGELFGKCISLTTEQTTKSSQYPEVYNVLFEEFVAASVADYVDGDPVCELMHFRSALSTVFRHRRGKVWLIGNSMNTSNPYFEFFKIDGSDLNVGDCKRFTWNINIGETVVEGASLAVEYVPIGYTDANEVPVMMRIPDNEIATSGAIEESDNVTDRIAGVYNESGYFIGWTIDEGSDYQPTFRWSFDGSRVYFITQFYDSGDVFIIESGEQRNAIHLEPCDPDPDMFQMYEARKIKDPNITLETGVEVGGIYFASPSTEYHYMSDVTAYNKRMRFIQDAGLSGGYDSTTQNGRRQINDFANNHENYIGDEMFVRAERKERNLRKSRNK